MQIDIRSDGATFDVTNEHKIFEGTEYEEQEFCVKCNRLTRSSLSKLNALSVRFKGSNEWTDNHAYDAGVFMRCVQDWDFMNPDGSDIPCDKKNKERLLEVAYDLSGKIIQAILLDMAKLDIEEAEVESKQ